MSQSLKVLASVALVFFLLQAAYASDYEIYVSNHLFTGNVVIRAGKTYVSAPSMAKALDLPMKEENGALFFGDLPKESVNAKVVLNGKPFADAFQTKDGEWLVELQSFVTQSGHKIVINNQTKIIDIVSSNTKTLSQKEAEALVKKSAEEAASTETTSDFLTYASPKYGVSLKYPKTWEKVERIMGAVVAFRRPIQSESEPFVENLNLIVAKPPQGAEKITVEELSKEGIPILKKAIPSLEVLDTSSTTLAGRPAAKALFHYTSAGVSIKLMQVVTIKNHNGYIFSYTGSEQNFDKYLPTIQAMLNSFQVRESPQPPPAAPPSAPVPQQQQQQPEQPQQPSQTN